MIFGNLKYADKYDFLTEKIKACFTYAKEHDLTTYEKGSYKINGDEFFVNIENYATVNVKIVFGKHIKNILMCI